MSHFFDDFTIAKAIDHIIPVTFIWLPFVYNVVLSIFRYLSWEMDRTSETVNDLAHSTILAVAATKLVFQESFKIAIFILGVSYYHIMKLYFKHVRGKVNVVKVLRDKNYIITGANTGIGFEVAKALLKMNGKVILACRSIERAKEAKQKLIQSTDAEESDVIVIPLDLCDLNSVRNFVKEFQALKLPLHGLVNNAGLIWNERKLTKDGFELTFASNYLGHFLLTNLLIPNLSKASHGGTVVNVSSCLHKLVSGINFEDLTFEKGYEGFKVYGHSKLANILFTKGLAARLEAQKLPVRCYAVHPGCVRTEFTRGLSWWMQLGNRIVAPILATLQKTPAQGAYGILEVLLNYSIQDKEPNGQYFFHGEKAQLTEAALNEENINKLWEVSEQLTKYTWKVKEN